LPWTCKLNVAVWPAVTVAVAEEFGAALIEKSTAVAEREITCGEFAALSAIVKVPVILPTPVGFALTLIVHELDGARDAPQLFVWLKLLLAPEFAEARIFDIFKARLPVFVNDTSSTWLVPTRRVPKEMADWLKLAKACEVTCNCPVME
jgi:hypothetical protein